MLGLAYNWKLGLVCTVFLPIVVLGLYLELRFTMGLEEGEKNAFEESSKLAIEAIANIRTVQGLTCEQQYVQRFVTLLKRPHQEALIRNHKKAGLTMLSYCSGSNTTVNKLPFPASSNGKDFSSVMEDV